MEQSLSLISAQVQFMDDRLALVHIPLDLYPYFLTPILQILFHEVPPVNESFEELEDDSSPANAQPAFLNLSITPIECSIMCPRHLANKYFAPLVERFIQTNTAKKSRLYISREDFIAMQVYGEGLEAGQRVLELTSPLAMAGISIFFISTYFSDYIIVPIRSKTQVIEALEKRGFQFEMSTSAFINNNAQFNNSPFSPISSRSPSIGGSPPSTPPPSSLEELQSRTFSSLRKNHIIPSVDKSLRLVQCAAHHRYSSDESSISILREALTMALVIDKPRFLSLTLTAADPAASLLLEKRLLPRFSNNPTTASSDPKDDDDTGLLLGPKEEILVPIVFDLRKLPLEATGIVCGVASRLADATRGGDDATEDAASTILSQSYHGSSASFETAIQTSFLSSSVGGPVKSPSPGSGRRSYSNAQPPTHRLQPDLDASVDAVEISFLSTARAGTIIVGEHELHRAVDALEAESHEPMGEGIEIYPIWKLAPEQNLRKAYRHFLVEATLRPSTKVFYTSWAHWGRAQEPKDIPATDKLTHICYAFADIGSDGEVHFDPKDPTILEYAKKLKKAQGDKTLLLSIGGWTYREHFRGPAGTDDGRKKFAHTAVQLMNKLGYQGLDIDWEGITSGDKENFVKLLQACREELDNTKHQEKGDKGDYQLFITASAGPDEYRNINFKDIENLKLVDYYSVMAYDLVTSCNDPSQSNYKGVTGYSANLHHSKQTPEATPYAADDAVTGYIDAGAPPSKLLLGMPLFGHTFSETQGAGTSYTGCDRGDYDDPSPKTAWSGTHDYKHFADLYGGTSWAFQKDDEAKTISAHNETSDTFASFDPLPTAGEKGEYARKRNLAGGMWWESNGDLSDKELEDHGWDKSFSFIRTFVAAFESEK